MATVQKITPSLFADFTEQKNVLSHQAPSLLSTEPEKSDFTQEDIDAAYNKGVHQGSFDAIAKSQQEQDHKYSHLLENINSTLITAYAPIEEEFFQYKKELKTATQEFLKNFIKTTSHYQTGEIIENLTRNIIEKISLDTIQINTLKLTLNPSDYEQYHETLNKIFELNTQKTKITLKSDPTISVGECYIEWEDGAILHHYQNLEKKTMKAIHHVFMSHPSKEITTRNNYGQSNE